MSIIMQRRTKPYGVYVSCDPAGRVLGIISDPFLKTPEGWIKIDEGYGDRYHHAQGNYIGRPLRDERGLFLYKLVDGKIIERAREEVEADWVEPEVQKTPDERIAELEAQNAELRDNYEVLLNCILEMSELVYA